ncbi:hypothetical protein R1flu_020279 [Riccia fluitans]|uniref:Uncharacterized protein n=1 Tax=Riccia fluitans TaxID=41844 RepID=A0ABD1ZMR5_9MARC
MAAHARAGVMDAGAKESSGADKKPTEIVVTNNALKMAQAWVKSMSGGADSDPDEDDPESTKAEEFSGLRPARLGLGAKYLPHSKAAALMTPVEKKLRAKINAARRGDVTSDQHQHPPSLQKDRTTSTSAADSDEEEGNEGKNSKSSAFGRRQRNTSADLLMPTSKLGKRKRLGRK